jgi:hypothetical protein
VPCTTAGRPCSSQTTSPPALGDRVLDHPRHPRAVVGVHAVEVRAVRAREAVRPHAVDAVQLVRPGHAVGRDLPLPAAKPRDLLRLGELGLVELEALLGLGALGDVEDLADVVQRLLAHVRDERGAHQRDDRAIARGAQAGLELERRARARAERDGERGARVAVRDELEQRALEQLRRREAEHALEGLVDAPQPAVGGHDRHAERGVVEQRRESLELGLLARGDVAHDGEQQPALGVVARRRLDPADLAVGAHEAAAERRGDASGAHDLLRLRARRGVVGGVDHVPERGAQQLGDAAPGELGRGRVDTHDTAVHRRHDERVRGLVEEPLLEAVRDRMGVCRHRAQA